MVQVERCCSANEASFGKDGHCWRGWPLKMIRYAQLNLSFHGMGRQFRLTCVWSSPQPGLKLLIHMHLIYSIPLGGRPRAGMHPSFKSPNKRKKW